MIGLTMTCALALVIAGQAPAKPAAAPAPAPIAIVGGRVVTVSGAVIEGGTVLVQAGKILRVGKDVPVPPGATVIPAEGKWVTPGFIEASTALGAHEVSAIPETDDTGVGVPDPIRAAVRMDDALNVRSALVPVARRQGVTSVVVTPGGGLVSGRSAWLDLMDGDAPGWTEAGWGPVAMHASLGEVGGEGGGSGSRALAIARLREALEDARYLQKNGAAYERNALRRLSASRLDLAALADVTSKKLPLVVEVRRAADIVRALAFAKAEGLRLVIRGGDEGWLVAKELAAAGAPVIVEPLDNVPGRFEQLNARADNAALLAAAGVEVIISTESSHLASTLRFVAGNAVRAGLPLDAALKAVTLAPARALGAADRYGALEVGKVANVVVWTGDPFEPSSYAEVVLVRGAPAPTESRQTRLRARYVEKLKLGAKR